MKVKTVFQTEQGFSVSISTEGKIVILDIEGVVELNLLSKEALAIGNQLNSAHWQIDEESRPQVLMTRCNYPAPFDRVNDVNA